MMHIPTNEASNAITEALKRHLRKKYPYLPDRSIAVGDWISYSTKYKKIYRISSIVILTWIFASPAMLAWVLYQIYAHLYNWFTPGGEIFFPCEWEVFILPGIFLSAATAAQVMEWAQRLVCGNEYAIFIDYHNSKEQYDTQKANRYFRKIFSYLFIFCLLYVSPTSLIATKTQFSFKYFFDCRSHTYQYNEIKSAICYLNFIDKQGNRIFGPHYEVTFNDNTHFSANWYFGEAKNVVPFIKILKAHGIRIDTVDVDR